MIRCTAEDKEVWTAAAAVAGVSLGRWINDRLRELEED